MTAVMIAFITAVGSQCEYWLFSSNFSAAANKSAAKPINVTLLCADVVMVLSCAVTVAKLKASAVPVIFVTLNPKVRMVSPYRSPSL